MTLVDFTPSPDLYPFQSRWVQTSAAKVHYVDEGQGRPILMLHGNPDWSFLYRNVITGLRDDFRCIAADYPGFGLSEHPVPNSPLQFGPDCIAGDCSPPPPPLTIDQPQRSRVYAPGIDVELPVEF